jgi:RHS repeat-associated protein
LKIYHYRNRAYDPQTGSFLQPDHLGSATVMTNRSGDVVQHYGYTAFGNERFKHNTAAFDVTSRYTSQPLDEETGLYFYQSRYYDPALARFTQADTIVPSSDTSQALNRYAYVLNNPLKFTDPDGHGWNPFKFLKQWIGTIITVALLFTPLAPFAALIGSAVGTLVNGGTFKSFAIGVGIGLAAGGIADGIGGYFGGISNALTKAGIGAFAAGALTGATAGAISSAVYGGNWGKNMQQGMMGGIIGAGVAMATMAAIKVGERFIIGMQITTGELIASSDKNFGIGVKLKRKWSIAGVLEKVIAGIEWLEESAAGEVLNAMNDGLCAWVDGVVPFADPLEQTYNPDDVRFSWYMGHVSRDAALQAMVPNIGTWAKNPVLYEIGQKTLPTLPEGFKALTAIERGRVIVRQVGWVKAVTPTFKVAPYATTIRQGLTPGAWVLVIGTVDAVDITTHK